jgi:LysR family transcriptional regulator, regulator of gene expression of beta-lactamase
LSAANSFSKVLPVLTEISLNTLRAFDAAARHGSLTLAGKELYVSQAAVSQQVKALEDYLGKALFRRTARGLVMTDEGAALAPCVADALIRMSDGLAAIKNGAPRQVLTIGVVGTFAVGFLMERLAQFRAQHPMIDLRMLTNNNKSDPLNDSLDCSIRFGDGAWRSVDADLILPAPMSPLCSPEIASRLAHPSDLEKWPLLRSYRIDDWPLWMARAGVSGFSAHGALFDTSTIMVQAAMLGEGIALAPPGMFRRELDEGRLVQPFALEVDMGAYWLTRPIAKPPSEAVMAFRCWLLEIAKSP